MKTQSLVLVPGLACDAEVWADVCGHLPDAAAPWVAEGQPQQTIGAMAETLLRDAPATRFALAGHSLGGRIALEVMRRAPQRVSHLALLDTGWLPLPADDCKLFTIDRPGGVIHSLRMLSEQWWRRTV